MRRIALLASLLAVAGAAPAAAAATPSGIPSGAPPAAYQREPALPAPSRAAWPFGETWSRTSGTGLERSGAMFWSDFVYDDAGPASPTALGLSSGAQTSNLAPTQGVYVYPNGPADANGADIFRAGVGLDATSSYWRVDWNTLADPNVPIAEWTFDTDDNAATGSSAWPASANVSSPGIEKALVVSSRGAWLVDPVTGLRTDVVAHGGALTVDRNSRSFIVRIPRSLLPVSGRWRIRLGAGLADPTGTSFAVPDQGEPGSQALPTQPRLYNVTFRTVAQEPPVFTDALTPQLIGDLAGLLAAQPLGTVGLDGLSRSITGNFWMEDDQADTLETGDVSKFSTVVDWDALARRASTPEPHPTGYSARWYVSTLNLGQGVVQNSQPSGDLRPNYLGRVQPYAVYVPTSYRPGRRTSLTWILHSLGVNYNQYGALDPAFIQETCQQRGSICAMTEGFGPDGWYFDEAEVDFWQVWHQVASAYTLDPDRTIITGYSMGGYAAYKLGLAYPDVFAKALALEGPPTCGIRITQGFAAFGEVQVSADGTAPGRCSHDGETAPLVENARWLPYAITQGAIDELVPVTGALQQVQAFDNLGYRYHFEFYPTEDHLLYATQDRFDSQAAALGHPVRTQNPPVIHFAWYPDLVRPRWGIGTTGAYWMVNPVARNKAPGVIARFEAASMGIRNPVVTVHRTGPALASKPVPGGIYDLTWSLGGAPPTRQKANMVLTDVGSVGIDTVRARVQCGTIDVTSDGPSRVALLRLRRGTLVTGGKGRPVRAGRSGTVSRGVANDHALIHLACPAKRRAVRHRHRRRPARRRPVRHHARPRHRDPDWPH